MRRQSNCLPTGIVFCFHSRSTRCYCIRRFSASVISSHSALSHCPPTRPLFKMYWLATAFVVFYILPASGKPLSPYGSLSKATTNKSINKVRELNISLHQYSGAECGTSSQCVSPRKCYDTDGFICSSSSEFCACAAENYILCDSSTDCLDYDVCSFLNDYNFCIGCNVVPFLEGVTPLDDGNCAPSDENDNSNVCIAVDVLNLFDREELLFKSHKRATVFCDQYENCATPGHMVLHQEKAMMMSSYCLQHSVRCNRRIKLVNSPRMKPGLRITSRHPDLQFTALAASKQTFLEQAVLKTLLYAGF